MAMLVAMLLWEDFETVPYHLAFVALAAVYGFRVWSVRVTAAVLILLTAVTGIILVDLYFDEKVEIGELTEIVLMPMILVAMAWHAHRRAAMQRQVQAYADGERDRWLREQEFLRDCSHALRTPLTIARGHVELIRDSPSQEQFDNDIDIVLGEIDHLNRLASRLLAIADVERPQGLRLVSLDAGALVRDAAERWVGSASRAWSTDVSPESWVYADQERLATALDALVENAVKATEAGGRIRLICRGEAGQVFVGVADDGPGVRAEDMAHVFDRFWRRPSPQGERGTGLGLAYARSVAIAHGGSARVDRAPEGGALVGMLIPAGAEPVSQPVSDHAVTASLN